MESMVERVARALWKQERDAKVHDDPFRLSWYADAARAAIAAMREPTEEMMSRLGGECLKWAPGAWAEMIDAALTPPE